MKLASLAAAEGGVAESLSSSRPGSEVGLSQGCNLGCVQTWCPSMVPENDSWRAIMWTHDFFKYLRQNSGTVLVPEYKIETLYSGTELGNDISDTQCLNTAPFCAGTRVLVLGHQVWTQPYISNSTCRITQRFSWCCDDPYLQSRIPLPPTQLLDKISFLQTKKGKITLLSVLIVGGGENLLRVSTLLSRTIVWLVTHSTLITHNTASTALSLQCGTKEKRRKKKRLRSEEYMILCI